MNDKELAYKAWYKSAGKPRVGFTLVTISEFPDVQIVTNHRVEAHSSYIAELVNANAFAIPGLLDYATLTMQSRLYVLDPVNGCRWVEGPLLPDIGKHIEAIENVFGKIISRDRHIVKNPWYLKR